MVSGQGTPKDPAGVAIPSSAPSTPEKGTNSNQINVDLSTEFLATCAVKEKAGQQEEGWVEPQGTSEHTHPEESPSKLAPPSPAPRARVPVTSTLLAPKSLSTAVLTLKVPLAGQPGNGRWSKVESRDRTFMDCVPLPPPDLFQ